MEVLVGIAIILAIMNWIMEDAPGWLPATLFIIVVFGGMGLFLFGMGNVFIKAGIVGKIAVVSGAMAVWAMIGFPGRNLFRKKNTPSSE